MKKFSKSGRQVIVGRLFAALCAIICIAAFMPSAASTHMQSEAAPSLTDDCISAALQPETQTAVKHAYVDLGLSVKWATCNVGASSPGEYGDFFAWGEIAPKSEYTEANCKTYGKDLGDISGNPKYDAARANWGSSWRMPTRTECEELTQKCDWVQATQNGHNGYKIISRINGKSIFLPVTIIESAVGGCWCSTPNEEDMQVANFLYFEIGGSAYVGQWKARYDKLPIRPVVSATADPDMIFEDAPTENTEAALQPATGTIVGHGYVDLGLSVKWATCNVGASSPGKSGDYFAWGEIAPKSEYTEENCKTYGKHLGDIAGNPKYDAARANWGGSWRMPTITEICELLDKCKWDWIWTDGNNGYKVTGPNGNSIFLPASNFRNGSLLITEGEVGCYWCSTQYDSNLRFEYDDIVWETCRQENDSQCGYNLGFDLTTSSGPYYVDWASRYIGFNIRPVAE